MGTVECPVYKRGQRRGRAHNGALYRMSSLSEGPKEGKSSQWSTVQSVQSIWGARGGKEFTMEHCTECIVYLRGQRRGRVHNGALYRVSSLSEGSEEGKCSQWSTVQKVQSIWGARGGEVFTMEHCTECPVYLRGQSGGEELTMEHCTVSSLSEGPEEGKSSLWSTVQSV
jgi:hypothetical protein